MDCFFLGEGIGVPDETIEIPNYEDNLKLKEDIFEQSLTVGNTRIFGSISTPLPVMLLAMPDNAIMPPVYYNDLAASNADIYIICYSIPSCQNPLQEVKRFVDDIKKSKRNPVIVILGILPNDAPLPRRNTVELGLSISKTVKALTYLELDIFRATPEQVKDIFFKICIHAEKSSNRQKQLQSDWNQIHTSFYKTQQTFQENESYFPSTNPLIITLSRSQNIFIFITQLLTRRIDVNIFVED